MKKIAILTQSLSSGGAEKQACILARELCSEYSVTLITTDTLVPDSRYLEIIQESAVDLVYVTRNIVGYTNIYRLLRKRQISVIFGYLLWGNSLCAILGLLAGVKCRIGGIRSSRLDKKKILPNLMLQNYLNTITIYNNQNGIDYLKQKGFNPGKAVLIPNCIEIPQVNFTRKNTILRLLSVGRFVEVKDYTTSLMAIKYLADIKLKFIYQIVGWGHLEEDLKQLIITLELEDYVELVISPSDIMFYYNNADIFLQTSLFEGLSNSIMEAMSAALPCVVSDVGDNRCLVDHSRGGYIVKVKDVNTIATSLENLILDKEKRVDFGKYNYMKISDEYSVLTFRHKYLSLLACETE